MADETKLSAPNRSIDDVVGQSDITALYWQVQKLQLLQSFVLPLSFYWDGDLFASFE